MLRPVIYFIAGGGRTRIGYSNDAARTFELGQQSCPVPLRLLRVIDGSWYTETVLHRHYAARRVRDKWFEGEFTDEELDEAERVARAHSRRSPESAVRRRPRRQKRERPDWTDEQWRRHDERVRALRQSAGVYDDPEARQLLKEMGASLTVATIERTAERAEEWYRRARG